MVGHDSLKHKCKIAFRLNDNNKNINYINHYLGVKPEKYFITKLEIDGEMDAWIDVMDTRRNERIRRGIG